MPRLRYTRIVVYAALLTTASLAAAESPDDAKAAFERGASAYEAGKFSAAAAEFARAYQLRPHAAAAFNEARARERSGDSAQAADAYLLALGRNELRLTDAAEARERLGVLEQSLGRFELTGDHELRASIGHLVDVPLPLHTHLPPGRYELEVKRSDGKVVTLSVPIGAGLVTRRKIAVDAALWQRGLPHRPTEGSAPRASSFSRSAYWFGGAALSASVGVILGFEALSARSTFDASGHSDVASHDRAVTLRTWANVALAASAGVGITGLVLTLHDRRRADASQSTTRIGVTIAGRCMSVGIAQSF